MKKLLLILLFVNTVLFSQEFNYELLKDINYRSEKENKENQYIADRCNLDIYYPTNKDDFATVIFFHGGGLKRGNKYIPEFLKNKEIGIVSPNYRLNPKVKAPTYIDDAAASVAWVFDNIERYGGNKNLIFVSGSSAGGYLTSMIGLDKSYLKKYDVDANDIAGLIPLTGQAITHFTVRDEMGIKRTLPVIDKYAPLFHVRDDAPPILLITGNRDLEMLGRYEENAYLYRMLKVLGHKNVELMELDGYGHGIGYPSMPILLKKVNSLTKQILFNLK
tara:strand:- start:12 stop:839 length:828 start_codon:yes stop_codon:yes gene_type:complete